MAMQRLQLGAILAVAMTVIVVSVLAASLLMSYQTIPNSGNVRTVGVGVYWNYACTSNVTSIDWGFLEAGDTTSVTVYIQNEGNLPLVLNMTTSDWNPAPATDYITLTWNQEGHVLNSTATVVQTVLTLSVSPDISEIASFSFDIIIAGIEQT